MTDPRKAFFDGLRETLGRVLNNNDVAAGHRLLDALGAAKEGDTVQHHLRNEDAFYAAVRGIVGRFDTVQFETIRALLKDAAHWPIGWVAYGLATAWHEARLKPIEEIGKGKGREYGKPGKHGGQIAYGRGLVQLTWDWNYQAMDDALGLGGSLVKDYSLALKPDIAVRILIDGMERGRFTGKSLAIYIGKRGTRPEFVQARRIINGTDRADLIAGYAEQFQDALEKGGWA